MYHEGYLEDANLKDYISFLKVQQYSRKINHYEQVQIIKIGPKGSNLNLTKIIWTRPKQFEQSKIILDL